MQTGADYRSFSSELTEGASPDSQGARERAIHGSLAGQAGNTTPLLSKPACQRNSLVTA
jgi:hypothetical protein